jgi:integrase/recombinase XerD
MKTGDFSQDAGRKPGDQGAAEDLPWNCWIELFVHTHCTARGLRSLTIQAYEDTLLGFQAYAKTRLVGVHPSQITTCQVLEYVEYLRKERCNGDSAINRHVTVLRNFYRAMVSMGHLEPRDNPLEHFPRIKAPRRKLPLVLEAEEITRLVEKPSTDTVLGLRDRTILTLLYGTGIRASECAGLRGRDIDWKEQTIHVCGKGGHERRIPLNEEVLHMLQQYQLARGSAKAEDPFFRSRNGGAMSRNAIYERVRTHGRKAGIAKKVSPHQLRHTFATALIRAGVGLVTVRDLLGHRHITSTQIYVHLSARDLREAAARHPIANLIKRVEEFLPDTKLPYQGRARRQIA